MSDEKKPEEMANYFYDMSTTSQRRNSYIYPSSSQEILKIANIPSLFSRIGFDVPSSYIYPRMFPYFSRTFFFSTERCHKSIAGFSEVSQSLFVIADLDSDDGLGLVKEALLSLVCLYVFSLLRSRFMHLLCSDT